MTPYFTQCCRRTARYCNAVIAASACSDSKGLWHMSNSFAAEDAGKAYVELKGNSAMKYTSLPFMQLFL